MRGAAVGSPGVSANRQSAEQLERCQDAVADIYKNIHTSPRKEYRNIYATWATTDKTDLKTRADSGDGDAIKQWDAFCTDMLKLLMLRQLLYKKRFRLISVSEITASQKRTAIQSISKSSNGRAFMNMMTKRYTHADSEAHVSKEQGTRHSRLTDQELSQLGKVTYVLRLGSTGVGDNEGGESVILKSEDNGDVPLILDMSHWVRKGAYHSVSSIVIEKWMAIMKKQIGDDMRKAEEIYRILANEVKDVDAEQLADQAETGITKDSVNMYMLFCDQCFQLVVLWQIIYNKPIPVTLRFDLVKDRPLLREKVQECCATQR